MTTRLFTSVIYRMLRDDPEGFRTKLAERMRQMGVPKTEWLAGEQSEDAVYCLARQGELSRSLKLINSEPNRYGIRGRRLAQQLLQQLDELQMEPPAPVSCPAGLRRPKVLHLLTNSMPYTNSGYTHRSHQALKAINAGGIGAEAVTRLAYPLVVGKWPKATSELVEYVRYHRLLPPTYPATPRERHERSIDMLTELVMKHQMSAIHTTTNFPNAIVASRVAQNCQIPWVYEVRGELEKTWLSRLPEELQNEAASSEFYRLAREQETRYATAADAVVVLSEISRRQLFERGVPQEKITVIPNAVESSLLTLTPDGATLRRELGLPTDKHLVGTVSALVDYEGLDVLIRALKELPENYSALIVGDGTARTVLEEVAAFEGVSDRVIFAGRQEQHEIWKWYSVLDVFTLPRRDTPVCRTVTPIKGLSAQALGIPVVASDLPALREVTGGLAEYVPSEDPEALASAIQRARDGSEGRAWAAGRTWEAAGRQYRQMYASLGIVPDGN